MTHASFSARKRIGHGRKTKRSETFLVHMAGRKGKKMPENQAETIVRDPIPWTVDLTPIFQEWNETIVRDPIPWTVHELTTIFQEWNERRFTIHIIGGMGTGATESVPLAETDYYEAGYAWDKPGAYMITEANGTHHASLLWEEQANEVGSTSAETMACAIVEKTKDFPGWRAMHVCVGTRKVTVQLYGGRYQPPTNSFWCEDGILHKRTLD